MKKRIMAIIFSTIIGMCFFGCGETKKDENEEIEKVKITFIQNDEEVYIREVEKGKTLKDVPSPINDIEGYTASWDRQDFKDIVEDIVVNVVYNANQYIINLNYGDRNNDSHLKKSEDKIDIVYKEEYSVSTPSCEGYVFKGWYYNGELFTTEGQYLYAQNITLDAKWEMDSLSDRWWTPFY